MALTSPVQSGVPQTPTPRTRSTNDLHALYMTKTRPEPSLVPEAGTDSVSLEHILLGEMTYTLSKSHVIMPCAPETVLYQETFFQIILCLSTLSVTPLAS